MLCLDDNTGSAVVRPILMLCLGDSAGSTGMGPPHELDGPTDSCQKEGNFSHISKIEQLPVLFQDISIIFSNIHTI